MNVEPSPAIQINKNQIEEKIGNKTENLMENLNDVLYLRKCTLYFVD